MEMGKKSKYGDDRMLAKFVPKGLHTRCLLYHLVWPRRRILPNRILRGTTCNLLLRLGEIYASTPDVTSIPSRNLIFHIFGCRDFVVYVRFVVACLLVDDRKIIAFEAYLPVMCSWGETMTRDLFFSPSKSVITSLNRHIQVSYKYIEGSE